MPSAQYVIDIAASMPEGESTIAELDKLTANLMGSGKGAEHFQQAIKQVSAALDAAKTASTAANAALAAGEVEYKNLERAALQAAKAEEKAGRGGVVPPDIARSAAQTAAAVNAYAKVLKTLETDAGDAAKKQDSLSTSLANVKKLGDHADSSLQEQARSTKELKRSLGELGGPLGTLSRSVLGPVHGFEQLSASMGSSQAMAIVASVGMVAVAAAVAVVTVALIAGVAAVSAWVVGLADTRREAGLTTEAFEVMNPAVEALHGTIEGLTNQTGLSESAIDGIAKSLIDAKVSAANLPSALEAATLAERALGNGGANEFLERMKASGKSVKAFAAQTKAELGGIVAKQMMGLSAQTSTLKTNFGRIFGGLNIDPVLSGFQKLVGLFDENSAAGQAMKLLFESVFQPLINQADNAATVIEAFVLGFLIGMTKLYISAKPAIKAVTEFFGFKDASLTDTLALATKAGEYMVPAFLVLAAVFGVVAVAVGLAVAAVIAIQVAIYTMVAAVVYAAVALESGFLSAVQSVYSYLSSIDLGQIGRDLIAGLAKGITAGAGAVVDSVTGAVGGAITSAKSLLGIHSPSKVFAEIGDNTVAGFAGGVNQATPEAHDAMADMVAPPDASALSAQDSLSGNIGNSAPSGKAPAASAGSSSSGGINIDLSGAHLEFNGVKDGPDSLEQFKAMLTKVYEQDAASAGGASPQAEAA